MTRPVPRNIDAPNRIPEFAVTFNVVFHGLNLIFNAPAPMSLGAALGAMYFIYRYTIDKPEGLAMRMLYRYVQIGNFRPTPARVKRFELS